MQTLIEKFAATVQEIEYQHILRLCGSIKGNEKSYIAHIKPGRKYTKVDIGNSGRYMIENATGKIFGIKGYGVIHRGHYYGTLGNNDF